MRYLVDTDWLIDALTGIPAAVSALDEHRHNGLGVSVISTGEVYEGAYHAHDPAARLTEFRQFLAAFQVLPLTDRIMERFARTRAFLHRQGNLIPDFDLLIAATALEHDLTLITRNQRHFERIPDLELYRAS
jgi:tRNA(fMet)-specific endonuclease VapC